MNQTVAEKTTRQDLLAIVATLAQAFIDEPGLSWVVPDQNIRSKILPGFFKSIVYGTYRNGLLLHASDNAAVTLWRYPNKTSPGFFEILSGLPSMLPFLQHAGPRAKAMGQAVHKHYPQIPFRYLQFAGVLPTMQGCGRGSALIHAGLKEATAAGDHVYLETAKAENVRFYSSFGFEIIDEWKIVDSDLQFTSMLKVPQGTA